MTFLFQFMQENKRWEKRSLRLKKMLKQYYSEANVDLRNNKKNLWKVQDEIFFSKFNNPVFETGRLFDQLPIWLSAAKN